MNASILLTALRTDEPVLLHGSGGALARALSELRAKIGDPNPLDLRDSGELTGFALRAELAQRTARPPLVLLLGGRTSADARAAVSELLGGQLQVAPGEVQAVPPCKVIAVLAEVSPDDALQSLFPVRIAAASLEG